MIASTRARGKGYGKTAVICMMFYAWQNLSVRTFEVKIGLANTVSVNMFKKLGFEIVSESEVFKEVTLQRSLLTKSDCDSLLSLTGHVKQCSYEKNKM